MRGETKRATENVVAALVVGTLHLAIISQRFLTEQGKGGFTLMVGCTFVTAVLWAMLAMRSLAADGPVGPAIDDGLTAMAVTAWLIAFVPPRSQNFLNEGQVDDFAFAYLPVSLLAVGVMMATQAIWKKREEALVWLRLCAALFVCAIVLAGLLFWGVGGDGKEAVTLRALGVGMVAAIAAAVMWWRRSLYF